MGELNCVGVVTQSECNKQCAEAPVRRLVLAGAPDLLELGYGG